MTAFSEISVVDVEAYWNRRPCNIRHSPRTPGTREYFDDVEVRKYFVESHIPSFAQFERWKGKGVLEIGCGIGTDAINFARAGAKYTAVDLSEQSVELCRHRFRLYGLDGRFYRGNAEELSAYVPVGPYDLIYSFGVIHHTPHPERVLDQLKMYCHPETELRFMLYSKWSWKVAWIIASAGRGALWRLDELVARNSEAESGCPVTYCYSHRGVRRLMKDFLVTEIRKDHIFPYKINKYVKYEYEMLPYFRALPKPWFRWLEQQLGWHTLVVAKPGAWVGTSLARSEAC